MEYKKNYEVNQSDQMIRSNAGHLLSPQRLRQWFANFVVMVLLLLLLMLHTKQKFAYTRILAIVLAHSVHCTFMQSPHETPTRLHIFVVHART